MFSRTTNHVLFVDPDGGQPFYRLSMLGESGDLEGVVSSHDLKVIERAYTEAWIRAVAVSIGIGFHPDTRADHYAPPLPEPLLSEYDAVMDLVCDSGIDPYEVGMDAWRQAGMIEPTQTAP